MQSLRRFVNHWKAAEAATDLTTAHEYDARVGGYRAFDTTMDLHNNAEGVSIGRAVWQEMDAGLIPPDQTDAVIRQRLLSKLELGELWIINEQTSMVMKSNGKKIKQ